MTFDDAVQGRPDDSFPANAVVSNRRPVDEAVVYIGFDTQAPLEAGGAAARAARDPTRPAEYEWETGPRRGDR